MHSVPRESTCETVSSNLPSLPAPPNTDLKNPLLRFFVGSRPDMLRQIKATDSDALWLALLRSCYDRPCDTPQHVSISRAVMTPCNMSQAL